MDVILTDMPTTHLPSAAPATIAIGQPMAARVQDGSAGVLLALAVDRSDTNYLIAAHGKGAPQWYTSTEIVAVTRGS
jgi:hypothetical protein